MSNYPDDIRRYDNDPRSPFYEEPDCCEECDAELEGDLDEDGKIHMECGECDDE